MDYTISDLLNGARVMATSVFGRHSEYTLQFNHEEDGKWYVDFPGWPFDHYNLMMVAGADKLCAFLSDDDRFARINVIPSNKPLDLPGYACLVQGKHSLAGGSDYTVTGLPGFERDIWLCPVTLFVLGWGGTPRCRHQTRVCAGDPHISLPQIIVESKKLCIFAATKIVTR